MLSAVDVVSAVPVLSATNVSLLAVPVKVSTPVVRDQIYHIESPIFYNDLHMIHNESFCKPYANLLTSHNTPPIRHEKASKTVVTTVNSTYSEPTDSPVAASNELFGKRNTISSAFISI